MTWTIESVGERPLTVNKVTRLHRQAWAKITAQTRTEFWLLTKSAKIPHLDRASFVVTPLHANGRSPQDIAACAPAAKAAIDGIVDAGVIDDDNPKHVAGILFLAPEVGGRDGLRVEIIPEPGLLIDVLATNNQGDTP